MVLLLLRCIEEAVRVAGVPSSNGWVASAIASALVYEDVESLDQHRIAMGRSPIPLLSPALARLRLLSGAERRLESRAGQPAREDVS
jgi:hypothetical protein